MPPKKVLCVRLHLCQLTSTTNLQLGIPCFQGKSSKSKKLNETDEEKAARLEAAAAAAQEGARRREEAARYSRSGRCR